MTSTAIPIESAKLNEYPNKSHIAVVNTAIQMTTGTNIPLTLSANFAIGALEALASSTNDII